LQLNKRGIEFQTIVLEKKYGVEISIKVITNLNAGSKNLVLEYYVILSWLYDIAKEMNVVCPPQIDIFGC